MFNSIEIHDSDDDMPEPQRKLAKLVTSGSESNETSPEKPKETSEASTSKSCEPSTSNSSNPLQAQTQVRHRSRKTQHTVRNAAENEIQFETIPLKEAIKKEHRLSDNDIKHTIKKMLESEEVQDIIQRIANERVRCNFLLATYQMTDINFPLNSNPEFLRAQFRDRLKKRKEQVATATNNPTQN
ncbi:uncharacterized protein LOC117784293 [Drosophila innubila]|uniref:uncharacterized protein LOC117784293 n=1 Tax=Drosophila innubila TaxID=198719 RepID=UPI00148CCE2B|nr:uncharacterized protein LOC117784293 [Drosophila innubila]